MRAFWQFGLVMGPSVGLGFIGLTGWTDANLARLFVIGGLAWFVVSLVALAILNRRERADARTPGVESFADPAPSPSVQPPSPRAKPKPTRAARPPAGTTVRERLTRISAERDLRLQLDELGAGLERLTHEGLDIGPLPVWRKRVEDWIEAEGAYQRQYGGQADVLAWERKRDLGVIPRNRWRDHLLRVLFRFGYYPSIDREDGRNWWS